MQLESVRLQQSSHCYHPLVRKCAFVAIYIVNMKHTTYTVCVCVKHFCGKPYRGTLKHMHITPELVLCLKQHEIDISSLMVCLSHAEHCWEEVDVQHSGSTQESIVAEKQNRPWRGYCCM